MLTRHTKIAATTLVLLASLAGTAVAIPAQDLRGADARTSSLAGTTSAPAQDLRGADSRQQPEFPTAHEIATAQERYYGSYGNPEPIARPAAPAASTGVDWVPIALVVAAAMTAVAYVAAHQRWLRRRRGIHTAV